MARRRNAPHPKLAAAPKSGAAASKSQCQNILPNPSLDGPDKFPSEPLGGFPIIQDYALVSALPGRRGNSTGRTPFGCTRNELKMSSPPSAQGLYDPRDEHDACGIGAVVNINGQRDHQIVELGKQVLINLLHRGAAGADERTGDGAGILTQLPDPFFRAITTSAGWTLPQLDHYGVAMVFLPRAEEIFLSR